MVKSFPKQFVSLTLAFCCVVAAAEGQDVRRAIPVNPPVATQLPPVAPGIPVQPAISAPPPSAPAPATNVPNVLASVNDTARFLAGLPVSEGSPLAVLTQNPAWQQHASFFDQAWAKLVARQFVGIRNWEINYLPDATQPLPVVFYMFSGPDFLYAHQFFPNANTYILAGTEPIGPVPDVTRFAGPALAVLVNLQNHSTAFSASFFTKDRRPTCNARNSKAPPDLPVFLARAGKPSPTSLLSRLISDNRTPPRLTSNRRASRRAHHVHRRS
jgi:hypothetical protein